MPLQSLHVCTLQLRWRICARKGVRGYLEAVAWLTDIRKAGEPSLYDLMSASPWIYTPRPSLIHLQMRLTYVKGLPGHCDASQVVQETGQLEGTELAFTGMLFQPVPWTLNTKKGMPADFEKYAADPEYVIINAPPNFMFQVDPTLRQIASLSFQPEEYTMCPMSLGH